MSVGASPDLYNILNTILSDVAPHNMSELYNIGFTDGTSSVSSGVIDLLSFANKTIGSSGGSSTTTLAFHHGTFTSSDYSSAYTSVLDATTAGHVYSNSPSGTYTWGTLALPSSTSTNTTYTWTPTSALTGADVLMVAGGGGGGRRTGGGGGAGGLVFKPSETVSSAQQTIVVGNGGTGASSGSSIGTQGANTTFLGYVANGGGAGSCDTAQTQSSLNGGSGGGAEWNTNAY